MTDCTERHTTAPTHDLTGEGHEGMPKAARA
jgi:hypothetical protein